MDREQEVEYLTKKRQKNQIKENEIVSTDRSNEIKKRQRTDYEITIDKANELNGKVESPYLEAYKTRAYKSVGKDYDALSKDKVKETEKVKEVEEVEPFGEVEEEVRRKNIEKEEEEREKERNKEQDDEIDI